MRKISVKVKITIWYLLLMFLMAALLLGFLLTISDSVSAQTSMEQLDQTVRENIGQVTLEEDGSFAIGEDFIFYSNGVYTLVYSQNESLLAGQVPVAFTVEEPFQNGLTRLVDAGDTQFYVLDLQLTLSWENSVWIRGILEVSKNIQVLRNLMAVALVVMPLIIALAGLVGFLIVRRAFLPMERIISAAEDINEASDLSLRVDVPAGDNEFARLARTFNQMFSRLERAFEAERQFTADASHELRTPVSVIKSACEYAEEFSDTKEEQDETIAMIHRQADKMSGLIEQLLSITRLEQGEATIADKTVDLTQLVETVCREQPYPPERLFCEAEPGISAQADPSLLTRLLQNLIDNGFKYGKPGGNVWVSLDRYDGEIRISVRDDGIGIRKEDQEKIWQRFYQADPSRSGNEGAGLGLSIVQNIARIHGGTMTVESAPDHGSTFTLHLPAVPQNAG